MRRRFTSRTALTTSHTRAVLVAALFVSTSAPVAAQNDRNLHVLRLEATPIGALPQIALPMPASRDHNYWNFRLQLAQHIGRAGGDMLAAAGGVDLQWRGGSIFGATVGWQERDCTISGPSCGGHALFGASGRFNLLTGGPTIAGAIDYSATTTLGAELGVGFAPNVLDGMHACTIDLGMPFSLAMMQRIRLVTWLTPSLAWDVSCSNTDSPNRASYLAAVGVGIQQLGLRGLDVYLGAQRIFRSGAGYQFGLTVSYIHLP